MAAANALIYRYRDINMSARKEPAPAYFEQDWRSNHAFTVRGAHDDIAMVDMEDIRSGKYEDFQDIVDKYKVDGIIIALDKYNEDLEIEIATKLQSHKEKT